MSQYLKIYQTIFMTQLFIFCFCYHYKHMWSLVLGFFQLWKNSHLFLTYYNDECFSHQIKPEETNHISNQSLYLVKSNQFVGDIIYKLISSLIGQCYLIQCWSSKKITKAAYSWNNLKKAFLTYFSYFVCKKCACFTLRIKYQTKEINNTQAIHINIYQQSLFAVSPME